MFAVQYPFSIQRDKPTNALRPVSQQWKRHFAKQVTQRAASSFKTLEKLNYFQVYTKTSSRSHVFPRQADQEKLWKYIVQTVKPVRQNAHFEFKF